MFLNSGCTVVSSNRVFPKFTWYWTADAKEQRREDREEKIYENSLDKHGNLLDQQAVDKYNKDHKDWQGILQQSLDKANEKTNH